MIFQRVALVVLIVAVFVLAVLLIRQSRTVRRLRAATARVVAHERGARTCQCLPRPVAHRVAVRFAHEIGRAHV